jgi:hypothetical protein
MLRWQTRFNQTPRRYNNCCEAARSLWSSYAVATTDPRLPAECIQLRNLLGRVPTFPTSSLLANKKSSTLQYHHSRFGLRISGISTWRTSLGECNLPPKTMCHELLCGVRNSIGCTFTEHSRFTDWPSIQEVDGHTAEENHLAIWLLAWAYILSARWIELQSPCCRDWRICSMQQMLANPVGLGGAYSGPTEWLCRVSRGFVSFQRVLIGLRVCPILAQIDCFKRAPVGRMGTPGT